MYDIFLAPQLAESLSFFMGLFSVFKFDKKMNYIDYLQIFKKNSVPFAYWLVIGLFFLYYSICSFIDFVLLLSVSLFPLSAFGSTSDYDLKLQHYSFCCRCAGTALPSRKCKSTSFIQLLHAYFKGAAVIFSRSIGESFSATVVMDICLLRWRPIGALFPVALRRAQMILCELQSTVSRFQETRRMTLVFNVSPPTRMYNDFKHSSHLRENYLCK